MLHGVVTLMARSLQLESRLLRTHLFRLIFVFFIYLVMLSAQAQSLFLGAPGLWFFSGMLFLNAAFIAAGGVSFFASAITEEKEENTLGLLMMTGLSPVGILFGKSTARMLQALLLLTVQFPFTLLAITLGGVLLNQVVAAYAALLAFTVLLSNLSLFWSVVCKRTGTAAGMTAICVFLYGIAPFLLQEPLRLIPLQPWAASFWGTTLLTIVQWTHSASVFHRLYTIEQTGFDETALSSQVISNVTVGVICFLLSWALFGRFALNADSQGMTRFGLTKSAGRARWLSPGRAWVNPLVWKDYHFLTGGQFVLVVKVVILLAIYPVLYAYFEWDRRFHAGYPLPWEAIIGMHLAVATGLFALESSIYASRIFHDEIRWQTMSALLTLPRSIEYVAYSKVAGCLLALLPTALFVLLDGCLLPTGLYGVGEVLVDPALWTGVLIASVFLHLIVLLSLFVKWGALPLAFVTTLMCFYCCPFIYLIPFVVRESMVASLVGNVILLVLWGVSCFVFQMMIHARLYELGSK
jgi:hypothetical protein